MTTSPAAGPGCAQAREPAASCGPAASCLRCAGRGETLGLRLLGDEADVARQHYAAAGELLHVADVQPGTDDGAEEAGQRLVVEADPAGQPGAVTRAAVGPADVPVAGKEPR